MHPGMFSRVNSKIMVRESENEGKHLFWAHFCVGGALLKELFGPKIQNLKIDNWHFAGSIFWIFEMTWDETFIKSKNIS